ncbi:hypothetical protein MTR_1g105160 [Medicago truncatula]|uniref:Uncharacterized protein n=1 Tax=Medicago truncatula TaxID=3880 RepID=G7IE37_MEDTR|nr:hypothetical protein MTR_1g105160 [Medicago truncatula]
MQGIPFCTDGIEARENPRFFNLVCQLPFYPFGGKHWHVHTMLMQSVRKQFTKLFGEAFKANVLTEPYVQKMASNMLIINATRVQGYAMEFEDAEVFFFYYQAFSVLRSWLKKNFLSGNEVSLFR